MKKYKEKTVEVTAVQWTGKNLDEVIELAGDTDMGNARAWFITDKGLVVNSINGHVDVEVGSWIVKSNKDVITGGKYKNYYLHIYTESEFEKKFEGGQNNR